MCKKVFITILVSLAVLILCISAGSVQISPVEACAFLKYRLFGINLPSDVSLIRYSVYMEIRLPRVLCAFAVGGILAVCGAVIQSVLQNPLASSYTLGVSSGASLGAAAVILFGVTSSALKLFLLPAAGFTCAFAVVMAVIIFSARIDGGIKNQTVILTGMVVTLFVSAVLTLLCSVFPDHSQELYYWMTGSFSSRKWGHVAVLIPASVLCCAVFMLFAPELDILSFGDEDAESIGVNVRLKKTLLIVFASLFTGTAVSFTGVIGFIDLIAPHAVRKIFGPAHRVLIPMSFFAGGAFMAVSDLLARTLLSPREIPISAVTGLIGAPFFAYIFFRKGTVKG